MGKSKDNEIQTQKLCLPRDTENLEKTENPQLLKDGEVGRNNGVFSTKRLLSCHKLWRACSPCSSPEPAQRLPGVRPLQQPLGAEQWWCHRPMAQPAPRLNLPRAQVPQFLPWAVGCCVGNETISRGRVPQPRRGTEWEPVRRGAAALWGSQRLLNGDRASSGHRSQDEDLLRGSCTTLIIHTNRLMLIVFEDPIYPISFQKSAKHIFINWSITVFLEVGGKFCCSERGCQFSAVSRALTNAVGTPPSGLQTIYN